MQKVSLPFFFNIYRDFFTSHIVWPAKPKWFSLVRVPERVQTETILFVIDVIFVTSIKNGKTCNFAFFVSVSILIHLTRCFFFCYLVFQFSNFVSLLFCVFLPFVFLSFCPPVYRSESGSICLLLCGSFSVCLYLLLFSWGYQCPRCNFVWLCTPWVEPWSLPETLVQVITVRILSCFPWFFLVSIGDYLWFKHLLPAEWKSGDFFENSPWFQKVLKTAPPPEIELLLFDAESENHIPENSPPPQKLNFYFLMLSPKIIFLKTAPPQKLNFYFLMLNLKIIFLKTAPPPEIELLLFDAESKNHIPENSPPPEIELLLFDAESENHIPENSPPPQKLNFYFLMLSPKIIFLKTAPPPEIELLLFDAESENHIPENSPPQKLNFYFLMLSPKIIFLKTAPPPRNWTSTFWCWIWKSYSWKQPTPPQKLNFYFLMLSPKIIFLKTAPPPEIELLLFDAESENHIPENSPPPQKLNFYFLMLSPKIIFLKTAPLLFDAESENHIPENSPPQNTHTQNWTSYFRCS